MGILKNVLRRPSAPTLFESGGSSGESSRRSSVVDVPLGRRTSLGTLSLRLSRSRKSSTARDLDAVSPIDAEKWARGLSSLPDELVVQILSDLAQPDLLALRRTSRAFYSFLQSHAGPITRAVLRSSYDETYSPTEHHDPYHYVQRLYPQPQPCPSTDYLLQMTRRQRQVDKMLAVTVNWIQMRTYMSFSLTRFEDFSPYRVRLRKRLYLAVWTMYHFLEAYRDMLVTHHARHAPAPGPPGASARTPCPSCGDWVRATIRTYPGAEVIAAYHMYELMRSHLKSLSQPPSHGDSIGRLRARHKPPTDHDLMTLIVMGGVPELCRMSMLKGSYHQRIDAIAAFVDKVSKPLTTGRLLIRSSGAARPEPPDHAAISAASFDRLTDPLRPPLAAVSVDVLDAIPDLDGFIINSDEWVVRIYELVGPEDRIVSAFGFVQNILAGKGLRPAKAPGDDHGAGTDKGTDNDDDGHGADDQELDYLAPVKGFE